MKKTTSLLTTAHTHAYANLQWIHRSKILNILLTNFHLLIVLYFLNHRSSKRTIAHHSTSAQQHAAKKAKKGDHKKETLPSFIFGASIFDKMVEKNMLLKWHLGITTRAYIPLNTEIFCIKTGLMLTFCSQRSKVQYGDIYVWIAHHKCYIMNGLHNHGIIMVTRNFTLNIPTQNDNFIFLQYFWENQIENILSEYQK